MFYPKHKVFISFHHGDQQDPNREGIWKDKFERMFATHFNAIISTSVKEGDISNDLKTETIRQKIRDGNIRDATVTIVLMGPDTWRRKHVDWEISSSIKDTQYNPRTGLIGIWLPIHPDFNKPQYRRDLIPPRLYYNTQTNPPFATLHDWTTDPMLLSKWVDDAFRRRKTINPDDSYPRFARNRNKGEGWQ